MQNVVLDRTNFDVLCLKSLTDRLPFLVNLVARAGLEAVHHDFCWFCSTNIRPAIKQTSPSLIKIVGPFVKLIENAAARVHINL